MKKFKGTTITSDIIKALSKIVADKLILLKHFSETIRLGIPCY